MHENPNEMRFLEKINEKPDPYICTLYGGHTMECKYHYVHIGGYYASLEEGLRLVCPNLKGKAPGPGRGGEG